MLPLCRKHQVILCRAGPRLPAQGYAKKIKEEKQSSRPRYSPNTQRRGWAFKYISCRDIIWPVSDSRRNLGANPHVLQELAQFRYRIRRFLRFSEQAARAAGVTPQQHQLMLGIAGFTGRGWANVSEMAEFLQERHNAVVELVARASRAGLVTKQLTADDRRVVRLELTPRGRSILMQISALHRKELRGIRNGQKDPLPLQITGHLDRTEAGNVHKS